MKNIKDISINTGYYWTIKILNKNSFLKNILGFADKNVLWKIVNDKLLILNNICKLNGESFFEVKNNQILNIVNVNDRTYYSINEKTKNYNFSYDVKLNKNFKSNYFINSFNLIIYFDFDSYFVHGGFNWEFNNNWSEKLFNEDQKKILNNEFIASSTIYLNNLIKNFFLELLENFSYADLANLISKKKINNLNRLYLYTNEIYTLDDLYIAWTNLLYDNLFFKFYDRREDFSNLAHEMFDFFSLLFLNYFAIANELKINFYLNNEKNNLVNTNNFEKKENINQILSNLANYLYYDANKMIPHRESYINTVAGLTRDNIFLSKPNVTYNVTLNMNDNFFTKDFYKNQKDIYLYGLIALYPEYFDVDFSSCNQADYDNFISYLRKIYLSDSILNQEFKEKIQKTELHDNFNYSSFVRNSNTLVFHSDNLSELDHNTIVYNNMAIANICMGKELNFRLIHKQWHLGIQALSIKNKFLYNQISQEIQDLTLKSNLENKNSVFNDCVKKFNKTFHLKTNTKYLQNEVKIKDEFDKRQRFIEIIILGFIVALLIAIIDYFNMVWSDLSCSATGYGAPLYGATPNPNAVSPYNTIWTLPNHSGGSMISRWWSGSSTGFTLFIILINTSVLIISLIYLSYASKKNKDISKRKDVKL